MVKLLDELWRDYSDQPQEEVSLKMEDERPPIENPESLIAKIIYWILDIFD
jgi:hypothetical protein